MPRPSAAVPCSRALEGKICPNQDRQIDLAQFNPKNEAWLPVLRTDRGNWHFSVLYSNTALAHQLGRTRDWVVVYFYDNHHQQGQHTVVTETRGQLLGVGVLRGREAQCHAYCSSRAHPKHSD